MNRPLAWAGALRRASSWRHRGPDLVGAGDVDQRKGVGGRLDAGDIHFLQLLDVAEDVAQLRADLLLLFGREREPRQVGDVLHINSDGWP